MRRRPEPEWLAELRREGAIPSIRLIGERDPQPEGRPKPRGSKTVVPEERWTRREYLDYQNGRRPPARTKRAGQFRPTGRKMRVLKSVSGPRDPEWVRKAADGFKRSVAAKGKKPLTAEQRAKRAVAVMRSWAPGGSRRLAQERRSGD